MGEVKDKVVILPNIGTAQEFICEFLEFLKEENESFSTHAMSEYVLYKQGQKNMLEQIILLLEKEVKQKEQG